MKNNKENNIWFYIFGLLSGLLFIPIIEEFINVIMSWIQVLLLTPSKKVVKGNKDIADMQQEDECQQTNCIGFQYNGDGEYYEDEE